MSLHWEGRRRFDAPEPWQCQNPECQTTFDRKPDTWPCQHPGCDVECCEEIGCKQVCGICDQIFCRKHIAILTDGPICRECFLSDFSDGEPIETMPAEIVELMK